MYPGGPPSYGGYGSYGRSGEGQEGGGEQAPVSPCAEFQIDEKKKVQVREFNGKVYIDIRDFFMKLDGSLAPSKKGNSMTVESWEKFLTLIDDINKAVAEKQAALPV